MEGDVKVVLNQADSVPRNEVPSTHQIPVERTSGNQNYSSSSRVNIPLSSLKSLYAIPIGLSGSIGPHGSFNHPSFNNTKIQQYTAGKILVVDDEKFNCDIIEGFLMILGFIQWKDQTVFAYNGEQAVDEIKKSI